MYKIAIVGEAFGEEEERVGKPFVGKSGQLLNSLLTDAGVRREDCLITNVFNLRPARNDLSTLCVSARDPFRLPGYAALVPGKYLHRQYEPEINRLLSELEAARPNITVLLGNTPCWALLGKTSVGKLRGAVTTSSSLPSLKVIPTYHPAAVLRSPDLRAVTVLDLKKAARESEFPEIRRKRREIWIEPSIPDLHTFYMKHIFSAARIAFDIETAYEQITCIGFATSPLNALVIPFVDSRKPQGNYWPTLAEELEAWKFVAKVLASAKPKVGQNGKYDIEYLWAKYGIPVNNYADDTMLLHHSLLPESPKGLAFLGSVYTDEAAWKLNRPKGKHTEKPEDEE